MLTLVWRSVFGSDFVVLLEGLGPSPNSERQEGGHRSDEGTCASLTGVATR